jgi:two-component system response regulator MprA
MAAVRVLIVDDDRALRDALRRALVLGGYEIVPADSGEAALAQAAAAAPDAVVLDIGLPDIDGLEVCRRLRGAGNRVPVLMLTARDAVEDRIDGLDAGADDYLVKPFDVGELQARLRALLRRSGVNGDPTGLVFEELRLDGGRHGVSVGESFVELTRTEYQLLELLMMNAGRVLPHPVIYERVWGYDFGAASNSLRVYVGYLRRKLERAGARPLLHTVRGVGYVLRAP